jgi:hypothetical protein
MQHLYDCHLPTLRALGGGQLLVVEKIRRRLVAYLQDMDALRAHCLPAIRGLTGPIGPVDRTDFGLP